MQYNEVAKIASVSHRTDNRSEQQGVERWSDLWLEREGSMSRCGVAVAPIWGRREQEESIEGHGDGEDGEAETSRPPAPALFPAQCLGTQA